MTTIQIDEETEKKTLEDWGKLQARLKRNISFDDMIKFLINDHRVGFRLSTMTM